MTRVLIVDDEEGVRAALRRRIERENYDVETADSAADAIARMRSASSSFDVVITDMAMEQADSGLAVLREALAHDVFTEVIVLTAYGNVANAVESMRHGAFDYIEKNTPAIDVFEILVMKIDQALERRRSSIATVRRMEALARTRG